MKLFFRFFSSFLQSPGKCKNERMVRVVVQKTLLQPHFQKKNKVPPPYFYLKNHSKDGKINIDPFKIAVVLCVYTFLTNKPL